MIRLEPGSSVTLPAARLPATLRTLFIPTGTGVHIAEQNVGGRRRVRVVAQTSLLIENRGPGSAVLMVMQGVPIEEPVVRSTVYVTNTVAELHQAKRDFQKTGFGGWPWPTRQPMHGAGFQRFARYSGHAETEFPPTASAG